MAAAVLVFLATLPSAPFRIPLDAVDDSLRRRTVRGAYHVHTTQSDGSGDRSEVAAAAARAGLQFVIFTDHGDGTRRPVAPAYLSGVLCLDGVEISTNDGHYVGIGMTAAPYPLGGDAAAVVEDVARLGGFGIAAHPAHPNGQLAWGDWTAPIDGLEWINLDAEWRDDGRLALVRVPFDYLLRPAGAIASLLDRPAVSLERWDGLQQSRDVIGLAAVDAHGRGGGRDEGRMARFGIGPGYEASFRTLSNRVLLDHPLEGDAAEDARLLVDAIRAGLVYSVVDAISSDAVLRTRADGAFELASPLPVDARPVRVERDGRSRLEIQIDRAPGEPPVPWVVSNWGGPPRLPAVLPVTERLSGAPLVLASPWRIEQDPSSSGQLSAGADAFTVHYVLGNRTSPFIAAAADLPGGQNLGTLGFRGGAANPMRVSVQLRFTDSSRWVKSVYLGREKREVMVNLEELRSAAGAPGPMPAPSSATSILFVVDLVNARAGESGSFTIRDLRWRR